jgi:hypothetical protein
MQQRTGNHGMHALRQPSCPHPYYAMPVAIIPGELLNEERTLQHLAHLDGVCFARIERQVSEDLFRIRISADPSRLDDNGRSHLLFVSSVELRTMTEIFQISSAIIPGELLSGDGTLSQIIRQYGACFACIERQIDWDLYAIRIAADPRFLEDEERSHRIYVSLAELQSHARASRAQQKRIDPLPPTNSSASVRCKDVEFRALQAITISEEEIRKAEGTMDPLEGIPLIHKHRPGSKFLRRLRQWIDLVLFRAVLVALEYQKDLQEAVRKALVTRRRSGKRLINIQDMYEIDGHEYWSVQVFVPIS